MKIKYNADKIFFKNEDNDEGEDNGKKRKRKYWKKNKK